MIWFSHTQHNPNYNDDNDGLKNAISHLVKHTVSCSFNVSFSFLFIWFMMISNLILFYSIIEYNFLRFIKTEMEIYCHLIELTQIWLRLKTESDKIELVQLTKSWEWNLLFSSFSCIHSNTLANEYNLVIISVYFYVHTGPTRYLLDGNKRSS